MKRKPSTRFFYLSPQSGFTLIEFLFVIAIFILLTGFIVFNLATAQRHTSIHAAVNTLVSDLKNQQIKAMNADTEGRGVIDNYGIYFSQNSYTLFHGSSYVASDPSNYVISLDPAMQIANTTFPSSTIIFTKGTGEVLNYTVGANTIIIKNTVSNEIKTITINQYGTVVSVN